MTDASPVSQSATSESKAMDPSPPFLAVDANGYVWRVYENHWSMAPSNPDNEPVPGPIMYYAPVGSRPTADKASVIAAAKRNAESYAKRLIDALVQRERS